MSILVFTGTVGSSVTLCAAAAALARARQGQRALLFSLGPSHGLSALFEAPISNIPQQVAPNLDALELDALAELGASWEQGRASFPPQLTRVSADELPVVSGVDALFGLLRLRELAPRYEAVIVDGGAHDGLVRALALPDSLRWLIRLLFGLSRGPGRDPASVGRAIVPGSLMPLTVVESVQDLRVAAEQTRLLLTSAIGAAAHYVLEPEPAALAAARQAIPALHLHDLAVTALLAGPLLPEASADQLIARQAARQRQVIGEARGIWGDSLVRTFEHVGPAPAELATIGTQIDAAPVALTPPVASTYEGAPALVIDMPGLSKGALKLALSGDELIVRVGPYRRHVLLPDGLRGRTDIRATREGDRLLVRAR